MRSSYIENNYAEVFKAIVDAFKPVNCVECGVLDGYSTRAIGEALLKNGRGQLMAYDLFEKYPFKHSSYLDILNATSDLPPVRLKIGDAYEVHADFPDRSVDFLHIDISNTGHIVRDMMKLWDPKMVQGGIILFEGGTEERDNVEWMLKYKMTPIKPEIESNAIIQERYVYATYLKFPGLTMLLKKR